MTGRSRARLAARRLRRELAALIGRRPAELVVEQLRTFAARHGKHLSPGQRHVLRSCERALGLPLTPEPAALIDDLDEELDAT
jgi:hypothetical protein